MQSLQRYEAFVKAAELGSFTRAAEALSYTQSGVSRMIGELERAWGVRLLARSRAGVHLTSEGERLIDQVRRVCAEQRRLESLVEELNGMQTGLIRIGTLSSMATHWLPTIVREFQQDYPNIDYELLLGDYLEIEQWVLDGRVDCGRRAPTTRSSSCSARKAPCPTCVSPRGTITRSCRWPKTGWA